MTRRGGAVSGVVLVLAALSGIAAPLLSHSGTGLILTVNPPAAVCNVGQTIQLSATLTNPAGHEVPSNRPVAWGSANTGIATVDGTGLLTCTGGGSTQVSASAGQASGGSFITVNNNLADTDGDGIPDIAETPECLNDVSC